AMQAAQRESSRWASALLIACVLMWLSIQTHAQQDHSQAAEPTLTTTGDQPQPARDSSVRLGTGDLLEISVYNVPELTTRSRINSKGDIYLPLVDYVHVQGLKPEEAQALIEKRLSDGGFLKNPHATVFVAEYASQTVNVLGEVAKPGIYP